MNSQAEKPFVKMKMCFDQTLNSILQYLFALF
jgi:hypothetical protein